MKRLSSNFKAILPKTWIVTWSASRLGSRNGRRTTPRMANSLLHLDSCCRGDYQDSSHDLSFSRALNRWEILFFSAFSISAYLLQSVSHSLRLRAYSKTYVLPSYSNMGSQPTSVSNEGEIEQSRTSYQTLLGL